MEAIALKSGTTMVRIPLPGLAAGMTAVLRNDVQMACLPAIAVTPHVPSGQVKILAISLGRRSALLPDYPTLKEAGIDVEADAWNGLIAPARTASRSIAKIQGVVAGALGDPAIRAGKRTSSWSRSRYTPAQFRAKIDADLARWSPVIKTLDLRQLSAASGFAPLSQRHRAHCAAASLRPRMGPMPVLCALSPKFEPLLDSGTQNLEETRCFGCPDV